MEIKKCQKTLKFKMLAISFERKQRKTEECMRCHGGGQVTKALKIIQELLTKHSQE
jgi:hypothetical protein